MRPDTTTLYLSFICALLRAKRITFDQVHDGLGPPPAQGGTLTSERVPACTSAVLRMLTTLADGDGGKRNLMIVHTIRERVSTGKAAPLDLREVILRFSGPKSSVTAEDMMVAYFAVALAYDPLILPILEPFFTEAEGSLVSDDRSLVPGTNLTLAIALLRAPLLKATQRGHLVNAMTRVLQGKIIDGRLQYRNMISVFPQEDPDDIPTVTPRAT